LKLDAVWWLVTPGNPLKDTATLPTTAERVINAGKMANHPRILVTGIEEAMGTRFTFDSLNLIKSRAPDVRFIWIMGADNLENFHRWNRWRDIARLMPIAVIDRPGATHHAARSRTALALEFARKPEQGGHSLAQRRPSALMLIHDKRSPLSSTALRKRHNFADK
jgi:nicotinate-nucleotide adenylyltransferase